MFKKRKNKSQNFIKNIKNRSDEEKMRLTWLLFAPVMVGVFILWTASIKSNFACLSNPLSIDTSTLPDFPETDDIDLGGVLVKSGQKLEEYMDENNALLQSVGDEYLKGNKILDEDGFSSLKFVDSTGDNNSIILEYAQYYKDIPVLGKGVSLVVSLDDDTVSERSRNLAAGIDLASYPKISLKDAGIIAEKEFQGKDLVLKEGSLAIANYEEEYYLVWKVVLVSDSEEETQEVLVGAEHGGIVSRVAVDELSDMVE